MEHLVSLLFSSPTTVIGAVFLFLVFYFVSTGSISGDGRKEPPGPRALPLLGNLLQLDLNRPYRTLCDLSKTYGSVFTVYFGPRKVVVLAGYKAVKEALVSYAEEFGEREVPPIFKDITGGHGILFSNGDSWKEMRRFSLSTLRDFGMGRRVAEETTLEECAHLIQMFENQKGKPFDTARLLNYATSNIISSIVYGRRFEYNDPRFRNLVDRANESIRIAGSAQIQDAGVKDTHFHEENLMYTVSNLFSAGTDTTATTLRWSLLLMAKYPHIQDQVQEELDRVVGSRDIWAEDRKNLPFTDAVIHETQRLASIIPTSIPHKTSRDVTFQGYFIKKDTTVFPLLTSVLHDESEWENPHTFNPSHFLDKEGKFLRRDAFLPFSAGRRVCLGEGLAKMELFLFFSSLLQRFRFTPPPGISEDELDLTPAVGFTIPPLPHELCAVSRQ
ncbi:cytochrome P450 2K4 isoform X2 [Austrofundulus limnaeus]|uniref:Cytochrome P450 2K4 isoform X2 n=1 Tax=Austrofundulus limnaeus TaxID=52670 RepID=A0A2I4BCQ8_AUSLI|nr:PREDICTED: cytochrome P450 2K4-like isoform X2 [Austrofundulus limnaeus]